MRARVLLLCLLAGTALAAPRPPTRRAPPRQSAPKGKPAKAPAPKGLARPGNPPAARSAKAPGTTTPKGARPATTKTTPRTNKDAKAPGARAKKRRGPSYPAVTLRQPNLGETLSFRPFDEKGRARKDAQRQLQRFLRCHHTGRQHAVDRRLIPAIYEIARHYGRTLHVYSGYRPPHLSARRHSRHLTGSAIDFRVEGVGNEALVRYLRQTFHPAGVGYYPKGVHVHLDLDRTQDTYWVDTGEPRKPAPDEATEQAESTDEETAIDRTAPPIPPEPPVEETAPPTPARDAAPPSGDGGPAADGGGAAAGDSGVGDGAAAGGSLPGDAGAD